MKPTPDASLRIHMPHWPTPLWHVPFGRPLDRMREMLVRLGNPHTRLPAVVHVAGTNGKGSTIAFLRAMMCAAGLRVHSYTSPHLQYFEERVQLAGQPIDARYWFELLERCRHACGDTLQPTVYEGTTVAALLAFAENSADVVLIETGMGGREDPTNVIDAKLLSVITPIGLDHTDYLGRTLEDIALHKAGIQRAGVPSVIAPQEPVVQALFQHYAATHRVPLLMGGVDWAVAEHDGSLLYEDAHGAALLPLPSLVGAHQWVNAGTAIAAISALDGFDIGAEALMNGLRTAQWPGRLERMILPTDVAQGWECWFDGAHNPHGAQAIAHHAVQAWMDAPLHVIFGTTTGKEIVPMLAPFVPLATSITAVPVRAEPSSYAPFAVQSALPDASIQCADSVAHAVAAILDAWPSARARILVFGSLYLHIETRALVSLL
jgi:dihydrofolate synthase / folylpolyglutamate synthase